MTLLLTTTFLLTALLQGPGAVSPDGRLVLEIHGDLWLAPDASDPTSLIRLTSGAALDIEPAWTADGRAVIFASDRAG